MVKKKIKLIIFFMILILTLTTLTGCRYFDVQKEQQEINENTIEYLNKKYSIESSFKKYERKDIEKVLDNRSVTEACFVRFCCPRTNQTEEDLKSKAGTKIKMRDETIVIDAKYDNRQSEKIQKDFENYYFNRFFSKYKYSDNCIYYLSSLSWYKKDANGLFNKYYNGNMDDFLKNNSMDCRGRIIIWTTESKWESECEEIANKIRNANFELEMQMEVFFMDEREYNKTDISKNNYENLDNFKQEGLLGKLFIYSDVLEENSTTYTKITKDKDGQFFSTKL